jgi:hypothetical protein
MLTDQQINEIASQILADDPSRRGFLGSDARSDVNFEGTPVIRVTARYANTPEKPQPLGAMHAIREKLLELGETRSVFLTNTYRDEPATIDDDAA